MPRKKKKNTKIIIIIGVLCVAVLITLIFRLNSMPVATEKKVVATPEQILKQYVEHVNQGNYEEMYYLLSEQSRYFTPVDEFVSKNKSIYEGIEAKNITVDITETAYEDEQTVISYNIRMDTLADEIRFSNRVYLTQSNEGEYRLLWSPQLIFPNLGSSDKVRVNVLNAERGSILDRNGEVLANQSTANSVGFVPGKMSENKEQDIEKAAALLGISADSIKKKLEAAYVNDDIFVPIRTIPKGEEELEQSLLAINGLMLADTEIRTYPFGEKMSHLTGYIQNVSSEDLEQLDEKIYNTDSVIGKAGLEKTFEEQLRGLDGYEIVIVTKDGEVKEELAKKYPRNGETIKLTIDAWLQNALFDSFCDDKSASVAMNPKTGEILALVSTPSYDANDFVLGMSSEKWELLNENKDNPMYNRFKAALCPGSGFKPIIGAIGLTTGKLNPNENYGNSGRSWQKDASWGRYKITTLKDYGDQVVLQNALIHSDNIYFAKAALNIGSDILAEQLLKIGFDEDIPLEIGLYWSSFSNTNTFDSEIQLADTGYGQAQVLINPVHMACMYSAFTNSGSMIKPYLIYSNNNKPEYWKENAFSKEASEIIRENLKQVIEQNVGGLENTEGMSLAGKTGTAEIKISKEDKEGTELGWFSVFTPDENAERPIVIITMVEDVKNRGGSAYVAPKVKTILEYW